MITIRPAQSSDTADLQALYERFVRDADWLPPSPVEDADFTATTRGERVFVAVSEEGGLIGAITIWEPESFIHCLFVDRIYQGQGVGTTLLDSLAPWLPYPWKLKCLAANRKALAFYRRRGWTKLETGLGEQGTYFLLCRDKDFVVAG